MRLAQADRRSVEETRGATGDGPIDAAFKAIRRRPAPRSKLNKFEVRSVTEGEDAQGESIVYVEHNERSYRGSSISTNIIESSAGAFLEVINRIDASRNSARPAHAQLSDEVRDAKADA